jgi:LCP family protein required for cell wall assembly
VSDLSTPRSSAGSLRQRVVVALVGFGIIVAVGWLALIIVSRVDEMFFPEGISNLPTLPGVDSGNGDNSQVNILVMGLDRRPSEGDLPTRTDTMFVINVDGATDSARMMGIPRDLYVEIPTQDGSGYYEERINTAFVTGEREDYPGGGPGLVKDVIEHNFPGLEIDHHVVIDFEGFIELIDSLGGVDIYVEEEINDPYYSETELPGDYTPLHFPVGEQHMDGQTALNYSRTRFDSSDLDRIRRQQQVIFAAIDKALEQRLVNPGSLAGLWDDYKDTIDTDINDIQAPGFAALASQISPAEITAYNLARATSGWVTPEGAQVLLADPVLVAELVQALVNDRELSQESALVEIQNAAGQDGLATDVVAYVADYGFEEASLQTANSPDSSIKPLTEIIDFTGKPYTANRLATVLGLPLTQVRAAVPGDEALRSITNADVVVILGADAQEFDLVSDGSEEELGGG